MLPANTQTCKAAVAEAGRGTSPGAVLVSVLPLTFPSSLSVTRASTVSQQPRVVFSPLASDAFRTCSHPTRSSRQRGALQSCSRSLSLTLQRGGEGAVCVQDPFCTFPSGSFQLRSSTTKGDLN